MQLSHARRAISVRFGDPDLVSCAGLAAVLALAGADSMDRLVTDVRVPSTLGTFLRLRVAGRTSGPREGGPRLFPAHPFMRSFRSHGRSGFWCRARNGWRGG